MADIVERIGKALALAERSSGAEAETALAKAQELAAFYAVDLEVARRSMANREKREVPIQKTIRFDTELAKRNTKKSLVELFNTVARANDVKIDIAQNSTFVMAYGFPSDIDMAERIFAVVAPQMVTGANAYLATGEHKQETVQVYNNQKYMYERKPLDGRTARINYYRAYVSRIGRRLREMRDSVRESVAAVEVEVEEAGVAKVVETGLVLRQKEVAVRDFYKATSRARGSWNGSSVAGHSASASLAGRRDAKSARLGRERQIGGQRTALR
jgi:Protein of unknown function (DUF2786)